eukprot:jgi/Ulvmu1/938/UM102_0021.1
MAQQLAAARMQTRGAAPRSPCRRCVQCASRTDANSRRDLLLGGVAAATAAYSSDACLASDASAFTGKVYFDLALCPQALRTDRAIGDKSALCSDPRPLGRLVIGLYGDTAPGTVSAFTTLLDRGAYTGTTINKIFPGRYIKAGKQGSKRYGEVDAVQLEMQDPLPSNQDLVSSKAFSRSHLFPGTVSWSVGDEDASSVSRSGPPIENTEFLITTGPGPALDLDTSAIVFGQVIDGLDVLREVAGVPTIRANETLERYNAVAQFFGDDRAAKARSRWGKPLEAVVIASVGHLP